MNAITQTQAWFFTLKTGGARFQCRNGNPGRIAVLEVYASILYRLNCSIIVIPMRGRIYLTVCSWYFARHRSKIKFEWRILNLSWYMSLTILLLRRLENKGRAVTDVWPREDMHAWGILILMDLRLMLILSNTCIHSVVYQVILKEHLFSLLERKVFQIVFILLPIGDKWDVQAWNDLHREQKSPKSKKSDSD